MAKDKSRYAYYYIKARNAPGMGRELLVAKMPIEASDEVGKLLGGALQTSHKFFENWYGWGYRTDFHGMEKDIERIAAEPAPASYIKELKKHTITLWLGPRG